MICIQGQLEEEAFGRRDYKRQKENAESRLAETECELHQTKAKVTALTRELQQLSHLSYIIILFILGILYIS